MASVINKIKVGSTNYNIASTAYATCATAAATVAKVAYIEGAEATSGFTLLTGTTIHVKFTNSNTAANPTLNVNGTGAKAIMKYGTTAIGTTVYTSWQAGAVVSLTYDGTNWLLNDHKNETTGNGDITGVTAGNGLTGGATSGTATLNVGAGNGISVTADAVAAKAGSGITVNSNGINVNTGYTTSGKNYKVQVDSTSGGLYVNVPWTDTDTKYTHPTYTSKTSGLYKITVDGTGHVSAATAVAKADITGLGIPGSDTNTTYDLAASKSKTNGNVTIDLTAGGSSSGTDSVKIKGSGATTVTTDSNGVITISSTDNNTDTHYTKHLQIKGNGTEAIKYTQDSDKSLNLKPGTNVSISAASGEITISATNTASAADNILDGSNSGTTITYAPYASSTATSAWVANSNNAGKLYLGKENPSSTTRLNYNGYLYGTKLYSGGKEVLTSHQDISGKVDKNAKITGATKCKITYDSKGLVTGGANLAISDIPDLSSKYLPLSGGGTLTGEITVSDTLAYTSVFSNAIEMYSPDGSETYIYPGSIELLAATGAAGTLYVDDDNSLL